MSPIISKANGKQDRIEDAPSGVHRVPLAPQAVAATLAAVPLTVGEQNSTVGECVDYSADILKASIPALVDLIDIRTDVRNGVPIEDEKLVRRILDKVGEIRDMAGTIEHCARRAVLERREMQAYIAELEEKLARALEAQVAGLTKRVERTRKVVSIAARNSRGGKRGTR